jgi:zinc D-Ala-D-Ala dipeptidase
MLETNSRSMWRIFCALATLFLFSIRLDAADPAGELILVDIKSVDPSIVIDLRYATDNNITHHALYPPNMPALIRPGVAQRLVTAQKVLRQYKFRLKIWDAYRPVDAQMKLWKLAQKEDYVANPKGLGSTHSWGVSVDATIVDDSGHKVSMPTDFDEFTPAAMLHYSGNDPMVRAHLTVLQRAMAYAGFYGLRVEWWHFTSQDWLKYGPIRNVVFKTDPPAPNEGPLKSDAKPHKSARKSHR